MSNSKHSNTDFISWDDSDLDLEEIGLETDRELDLEAEWSGMSEDSDTAVRSEQSENQPPKKRKKQGKSPTSYKCPECGKILKTIAGFRGHCAKQHDLHSIKADHNKANGETKTSTMPKKMQLLTEAQLGEIMKPCLLSAIEDMIKDKHHAVSNSTFATELVTMAQKAKCVLIENSEALEKFFLPQLVLLFSPLESSASMASGREQMWSTWNGMRFDPAFISTVCRHMGVEESMPFTNVLFEDFLGNVLAMQVTSFLPIVEDPDKTKELIPAKDMEVLHYVSGYIVRALQKQYTKHKSTKFNILLEAIEFLKQSPDSTKHDFLNQYKKWSDKLDRGGLIHPADDFFLAVRQIDICVRQAVDITNLSTFALARKDLLETVMEDFLFKHYIDKLLSACSKEVQLNISEHVISVFLKVRGHATAKHVRRQHQKDNKKSNSKKGDSKKGASLRKSLRDRNKTL